MATLESEFDPTRRDFLTLGFARRRRGGGRAPRKDRPDIPQGSPQPPDWRDWLNKNVSRRDALGLGVLATTLIGGGYIAHKLGWLFPAAPDQTPKEPETLEDMVAEAKRMEDEFTGTDLSDKETRNQYTKFLTDIFIRFYPLGISKEQLLSSVVFVNDPYAFEQIFIDKNQDPKFTQELLKNVAARTPAFTADGKTYVNTTYEIFQKEVTSQDPKFPKDWHPLKSLRLTLFHEFNHVIAKPTTDSLIFSILDPSNQLTNKLIDGFRVQGLTKKKEFVGFSSPIDEALVELLSKDINTNLFGSFISEYTHELGINISNIMNILEQILIIAKVDKQQLAYFHQTSDLKGF